jgi:hypothetical protein
MISSSHEIRSDRSENARSARILTSKEVEDFMNKKTETHLLKSLNNQKAKPHWYWSNPLPSQR